MCLVLRCLLDSATFGSPVSSYNWPTCFAKVSKRHIIYFMRTHTPWGCMLRIYSVYDLRNLASTWTVRTFPGDPAQKTCVAHTMSNMLEMCFELQLARPNLTSCSKTSKKPDGSEQWIAFRCNNTLA